MTEVEIYLATGEAPISFLCIPIKDVERLSVWPFKWPSANREISCEAARCSRVDTVRFEVTPRYELS